MQETTRDTTGTSFTIKISLGTRISTTAKIAKELKKLKFKIRYRNRCKLCGRPRAYYRKFELCRICFRKLALEGQIPGVRKASW